MPQVFISHSTEDAAVARQVADALRGAGIGVWIAPDSIPPGEAYNEAIVVGLKASDTFAILVSRASNASKHVAREWAWPTVRANGSCRYASRRSSRRTG